MTTLLDHLQDFSQALVREPLDAVQTLQARAWAARRQPPPPLRTRVHPHLRRRDALPSTTALERAVARLAARLDDEALAELRADAPMIARVFEALRVGPQSDAWIRELLDHAAPRFSRAELDHAAGMLDREQGAAFGMILVLALDRSPAEPRPGT